MKTADKKKYFLISFFIMDLCPLIRKDGATKMMKRKNESFALPHPPINIQIMFFRLICFFLRPQLIVFPFINILSTVYIRIRQLHIFQENI